MMALTTKKIQKIASQVAKNSKVVSATTTVTDGKHGMSNVNLVTTMANGKTNIHKVEYFSSAITAIKFAKELQAELNK